MNIILVKSFAVASLITICLGGIIEDSKHLCTLIKVISIIAIFIFNFVLAYAGLTN